MKLVFKVDFDDPLDIMLAAIRYRNFWKTHEGVILESFARHTGLEFRQKQITVRCIDEAVSRAGTKNKPMQLTARRKETVKVAANLLHELAHRLVIGNGIYTNAPNWNYHVHRHIDLFLYDVWTDVLGKKMADQELYDERTNDAPIYRSAWDWSMGMSYQQRQAALKRLYKKYGVKTSPDYH